MTDVKRWDVYSDFEALPPARKCIACENYFTGDSQILCGKCRQLTREQSRQETKKAPLPATEKQLERINELKDHPAFQQEELDWLLTAIEKGMLNTRGQAGILINQMKKKCGIM